MWVFSKSKENILTLLYRRTPNIANIIPKKLKAVTGFPSKTSETAITDILFNVLHTEYVSGDTNEIMLNATIFCIKLQTPSANKRKQIKNLSFFSN